MKENFFTSRDSEKEKNRKEISVFKFEGYLRFNAEGLLSGELTFQ